MMEPEARAVITTISFPLPYGLGTTNCFLLRTSKGFVLIDAGSSGIRAELDRRMREAGCLPGSLSLILITHADGDHTGNAAHIRDVFGGVIALHPLEAAAAEGRNDTLSRTRSGFQRKLDAVLLAVLSLFINLGAPDAFTPDLLVDEDFDPAPYGLNARILHLPGHSRGSIGILDADGNLFCGDLLWNRRAPGPHMIRDNKAALNASIRKIRDLAVTTVYPGHGDPFPLSALKQETGGGR
jgi:hydroxyacylglutathione hydrolase